MNDRVRLTLDEVHDLATAALRARGFSERHARAIADTVTAAERDECTSHGLFRIPFYVKALLAGNVSPNAEPTFRDLAPAVLQADAHLGFAPLTLQLAADPLEQRARDLGIAALCIVNAYNVAALWPETERLAERGLVAFAFTAALQYVAPAGGTKPVYGTNPMAFAWPRAGRPPLVFDQASSASARGEIQIHQRAGKPSLRTPRSSSPRCWSRTGPGFRPIAGSGRANARRPRASPSRSRCTTRCGSTSTGECAGSASRAQRPDPCTAP